ncbi:hypothetical protein [Parapedobacter indicus]|uniref:Uncharacterized protein n=1 Tax=Parapedobacter indicus TaxID=1477437 RepID=A0A1I3TJ72_9SPHI|nr:hypothetical protein [Parapedobacter indicus]PPK99506.1 hypothetical protein CLV26_11224 [Parapedobacter indicus]SFJ69671.1 hypothetical protein SAMN05444682_112157 [Parapedobacter indicus]
MSYADRSDPKFGKRGVVQFRFAYGGDEWDFGYVTIFFIQHLGIGPLLKKSNAEAIKQLDEFRVFELISAAEQARINMTRFELDGMQSFYFAKMADQFCKLLVHPDSEQLADTLVGYMQKKHTRFKTGKALMDFYLPIATDMLADFNDHYKTVSHGQKALKLLWEDKNDSL